MNLRTLARRSCWLLRLRQIFCSRGASSRRVASPAKRLKRPAHSSYSPLVAEILEIRATPSISFDPVNGLLTVKGNEDGPSDDDIRVYVDGLTIVTVKINGMVHSADPSSPNFDAALERATPDKVRKVVVRGGTGDDTLSVGEDFLSATLRGGRGNDWVDYSEGRGGVYVQGHVAWRYAGAYGDNKLRGIENVIGSAFHDLIIGDRFANILLGGGGNDQIFGWRGKDTLDGGDGNDSLGGGPGYDLLIGNDGNDTLDGWDGDDTLDGGNGDDFLVDNNSVCHPISETGIRSDGNDVLNGGTGDDTLQSDYSSVGDMISNIEHIRPSGCF